MLSAREVAERLGKSVAEVRRLAGNGMLPAERVGGALAFSPLEVERLARIQRGPGRLWSLRSSWAAVELLNGWRTDLIDQPRRSRLRSRMRELTPAQLHGLSRSRAQLCRIWAPPPVTQVLARTLALTGPSAVTEHHRNQHEALEKLPAHGRLDGYLTRRSAAVIREANPSREASGNVLLRLVPEPDLARRSIGSDSLVALDLMDSDVAAEREAGAELVETMLRDL